MYYNDYLAHHQVKGAKWGVMHGPPYPVNRDSSGKPKITTVIKSRLKKRAEERQEKRHENDKKQVIDKPTTLYKNRNKFSDEELEQIVNRINLEAKIKDINESEMERGLRNFDRVQKFLQTSENAGKNLMNIYDLAANVHNAFVDAGKINGERWVRFNSGQGGQKNNNSGNGQNNAQNNASNSGNVNFSNKTNSDNTVNKKPTGKNKK